MTKTRRWLSKPFRLVEFSILYLVTLWRANIRIALDIITPGLRMQPGFIAIGLRTRNDFETLLFANLVSMTPGSLSVDVSRDGKTLFVHATYLGDREKVQRQIGDGLQSRLLEILE